MNIEKKFNEALNLLKNNSYGPAEKILKQILKNNPSHTPSLTNLATLYFIKKNYEMGVPILEQSIKLDPNQPIANLNLGAYFLERRDYEKSIKYSTLAIRHNPELIRAFVNNGHAYKQINNYKQSNVHYKKVMESPENINFVLLNYIDNLIIQKKYNEAIKEIELHAQNDSDFLYMKSICLLELNHESDAIEILEKLVMSNNDNEGYIEKLLTVVNEKLGYEAYKNCLENLTLSEKIDLNLMIGKIEFNSGNIEAAGNHINKFHENHRETVESLLFSAFIEIEKSNYENAKGYFEIIVRRDAVEKSFNEALMNYGSLMLFLGDYKNGWKYYNYRYQTFDLGRDLSKYYSEILINKISHQQKSNKPKRLILQEQGVGDLIIYLSAINRYTKQANIYLACDKRLHSLFERSIRDITFIDYKEIIDLSEFDSCKYIGEFAADYVNSIELIEGNPFLSPDPNMTKEFKSLLSKTKKNIGISWKSKNNSYKNKSATLMDFDCLLRDQKFNIVNLQYGNIEEDLKRIENESSIQIIEELDIFNDLDGLTALINACDFVVTTSNITAHLAGSIGKKTYLLCPKKYLGGRLWYWTRDFKRNKTPWYDSIEIIEVDGNSWAKAINKIKLNSF